MKHRNKSYDPKKDPLQQMFVNTKLTHDDFWWAWAGNRVGKVPPGSNLKELKQLREQEMIDLSKPSGGVLYATYNGWTARLMKTPKDKDSGLYLMELTRTDRPVFIPRIFAKYTRFGKHIPKDEDFNLKEKLKI